jgi:hypothetical protein
MLLFFHGVPKLRDFATPEGLTIVLILLAAWGVAASLFHPDVRRQRERTSG